MVNFLNEENYKIEFEKIALPYLNKRRTNSYFNGSCGNLFYSFFKADKERGRVIIIHGYTESTEKYLEVINKIKKEIQQKDHINIYIHPITKENISLQKEEKSQKKTISN